MWIIKLGSYLLGLPNRAFAATGQGSGLFDPLNGLSLQDIANRVIDLLLVVGGPIAAIMVLVGGYQIMTAAGNPEQFSKGQKTILYAAAGFVVVMFAKGVVAFIQSIFQ